MQRGSVEAQLVRLLQKLIHIPSVYPPGDTSKIARFCFDFVRRLGYRCAIHEQREGVKNVVARIGEGKPSLAFTAHLDTVGPGDVATWTHPPFSATRVGDRVYGLGASNCKASVAVQLWVAQELAKRERDWQGEVCFAFVGDEENLGPDGLSFLRQSNLVRPDILVVGAPTDNSLVLQERGVMWVRLLTRGRAAHAGAPELGESAIRRMHRVISAIEAELTPMLASRRSADGVKATFSIGKIQGGHNTNVVPDECWIEIDRRLLPNEKVEDAFDEVKRIAMNAGAQEAKLLTGTRGFSTAFNGKAAGLMIETIVRATGAKPALVNALGASDGRYFAADATEILVYGPGDGAASHKADEYVSVDQMTDAALIQLDFVLKATGIVDLTAPIA